MLLLQAEEYYKLQSLYSVPHWKYHSSILRSHTPADGNKSEELQQLRQRPVILHVLPVLYCQSYCCMPHVRSLSAFLLLLSLHVPEPVFCLQRSDKYTHRKNHLHKHLSRLLQSDVW